MVCVKYGFGQMKYFSANEYGGVGNAKNEARKWLREFQSKDKDE